MTRNLVPRREDFLAPFEQVFDKFFDDFFHSNPLSQLKSASGMGYPKMNVSEKDNEFIVTLSVPGMKSEDIDIEVDSDNVFRVRGKMSLEHQAPEGSTYYVRELRQSAFERSFQLPDYVLGDPQALMRDGILRLAWKTKDKKPEGVRKIAVKNE